MQMEVITRTERRRKYSDADKDALIAQCELPHNTVKMVAEQNDISPSVLYNWRSQKKAREQSASGPIDLMPFGTIEDLKNIQAQPEPKPVHVANAAHSSMPMGRILMRLPNGTELVVDSHVNEHALQRVLQSLKACS
ncbi:hypothetical protein GCM10009096_07130 [Parasphingorhabdus litoris]|uniref:Transposase n=1 Tax=Parasphingorhabdus litoris TaxID=394733 RepID=A0ABN1A6M7_9SPHN|nr:transposase [Parasphingorhabdus litoris]